MGLKLLSSCVWNMVEENAYAEGSVWSKYGNLGRGRDRKGGEIILSIKF